MNLDGASADVYFEQAGLNRLRRMNRENSPETIKAVAAEFESMFIRMMLKSMRDTGSGDPLFDSDSTLFYRDMFDQQLAVDLSKRGGVGLADMLVQQMSGAYQHVHHAETENGEPKQFPVDNSRIAHSTAEPLQPQDEMQDTTALPAAQDAVAPSTPEPAKQEPSKHTVVAYAEALRLAAATQAMSALAPGSKAQTSSPRIDLGTPTAFIDALRPLARKAAGDLGVQPEVLLAQAALETGWGKGVIRFADGRSSYNLFNIKADERWKGDRVSVNTLEYNDGVAMQEKAAFRAYGSFEESFSDYVDFLRSSPRYRKALEQAGDAASYIRELQKAGYATDPEYAAKVQRILGSEPMASATDPALTLAAGG